MISTCKEYLVQKLKAAGIKSKVCTSMKELRGYRESHVGAVIPDRDTFSRAYSKKLYRDENMAKHKRRKMFERETTFVVVIGEYSQEQADAIFEAFLALLDPGILIDGNYTALEVEEADWVDKEDSILQAKIAVQLKVTFRGGVYKDTDFAKVNYHVRSIEKEDGYGEQG